MTESMSMSMSIREEEDEAFEESWVEFLKWNGSEE
jgi:hypothetical protein